MKRASYRDAIFWIAANDDTDWVHAPADLGGGVPSVTATLVADLFGVDTEKVRADIARQMNKLAKAA